MIEIWEKCWESPLRQNPYFFEEALLFSSLFIIEIYDDDEKKNEVNISHIISTFMMLWSSFFFWNVLNLAR